MAKFLGAANLIPATRVDGGVDTAFGFLALEKVPPWTTGTVAIRPEWIGIGETQPAVNGIRARVSEIVYRGTSFDLWLEPGPYGCAPAPIDASIPAGTYGWSWPRGSS